MIRALVVETIYAENTPLFASCLFDTSLLTSQTRAATGSSVAPTPTNNDVVFSIYHNRPTHKPVCDVAN